MNTQKPDAADSAKHTQAKHSPLPWVAAAKSGNVLDRRGCVVAKVEPMPGNDPLEKLANSVLLASAPELLEEARLSIVFLELSLKAHNYLTTLEHERLARLRALVSKVEGRA